MGQGHGARFPQSTELHQRHLLPLWETRSGSFAHLKPGRAPINSVAQQITIQNNDFFGVEVFNSLLVFFFGPVHILNNAAGIPSDHFFFPYRAGVLLRFGSLAIFFKNENVGPAVIDGNTGPGILAHVSTMLFLQGVTMSNNTGDGLRLQHLSVAESTGQNTTIGNGGAGASCDQNSELFGDVDGFSPNQCLGATSQPEPGGPGGPGGP